MTKLEITLIIFLGTMVFFGIVYAFFDILIKKREEKKPQLTAQSCFKKYAVIYELGRVVYDGYIKNEYVDALTSTDICILCDGYKSNKGYKVTVGNDGHFNCIVFTD